MRRILTVTTALFIGSVTADAAIEITIAQVGPDVVITFDGSLDVFTPFSNFTSTLGAVESNSLISLNGSTDRMSGGVTLDSGLWTAFTTGSGIPAGDTFLFADTVIDAPSGYVAGNNINGSLTFLNMDLVNNMGFTLGDSGAFTGSGNTINFTVVPEPSTTAALAGLATLGFVALRRRKS